MPLSPIDWWKINSRWSLPYERWYLPWPIVFVTTDLINEYFGERGVKVIGNNRLPHRLYLVIIYAGCKSCQVGDGLVSDDQFNGVFGQSLWILLEHYRLHMVSTNRCYYFSFF
jgi:hypothetical protein